MIATRLRLWELLPDARQPTPVLEYFGDAEVLPLGDEAQRLGI